MRLDIQIKGESMEISVSIIELVEMNVSDDF